MSINLEQSNQLSRPEISTFVSDLNDAAGRFIGAVGIMCPGRFLREAIVIGAGRPLQRTVQFYAQCLAKHERSHLKQFQHIVTRCVRSIDYQAAAMLTIDIEH
jgi:hypothetical protein